MKSHSIPKQGFGFFDEDKDGETLLYRPGARKAIHLNQTAAVVWKLCDGSRSVQDIIDLLKGEYPGSEADVAADVLGAIEKLVAEGALLETVAPVRGKA